MFEFDANQPELITLVRRVITADGARIEKKVSLQNKTREHVA